MTDTSNQLNTPWTIRHDDDDYWCVVNTLGVVIFARTGVGAEATARLIAAAPKLLEALKAATPLLEASYFDHEASPAGDAIFEGLEIVRDAIAIAEATDDLIGRAA